MQLIRKIIFNFIMLMGLFYCGYVYANDRTIYLDQAAINNKLCIGETCFFPENIFSEDNIYLSGVVKFDEAKELVIHTKGKIMFMPCSKLIAPRSIIINTSNGIILAKDVALESSEGDIKIVSDHIRVGIDNKFVAKGNIDINTESEFINNAGVISAENIKISAEKIVLQNKQGL